MHSSASEAELEITAIVAGGDGLAREENGRVVFVRGAVPGERVLARFTHQKRDFARAEVVRVITSSSDRVEPPCRYVAAGCGGCDWQHIAPGAQARFKRDIVVDALRRIARVDEPLVNATIELPAEGYRTTVRVAVTRDGRAAFRKHASHDLVAIDECLVAHPSISARMREERWPDAHEVTLRVDDHQEVAGRRFRVSADSFFQVRPDGAAVLVDLVAAALADRGAQTVVDLYAGVGLFAGTLADRGFDVVAAVEGNPSAVADAHENLRGVCEVVAGDVAAWAGARVDGVVADPSRDGLRADGVATVLRCEPDVVVLVSCDPAALGRDARLLLDGGFTLNSVQPVDLFPQTAHVEVVSTFVRL